MAEELGNDDYVYVKTSAGWKIVTLSTF